MKKTLLKSLLTGLMILGFYINAAASPIADYVDTFYPTYPLIENGGNPIEFQFDIESWDSFDSDKFKTGWISFDFTSKSKSSKAEFAFKLSDVDEFETIKKTININNDHATWRFNLNPPDFKNNFNGTIWAQLTATDGSFDFNSATLHLKGIPENSTFPIGDNETTANPEPTTMLLVGFGLLGLAGLSRRKSNHLK